MATRDETRALNAAAYGRVVLGFSVGDGKIGSMCGGEGEV